MATPNNKTSLLISTQVPQFVREDHETFVQFLEEYYKFLERDGELEYVTKNFLNYLNIDTIKADVDGDEIEGHPESTGYHEFLQKLYDTFIKLIPAKVLTDRSLILKHAKDFYRARGSEKSTRFLLRILFNKEAEFYYPKTDILKASDGKWYRERSIRVSDVQVNNVSNTLAISNFAAKTITGNTTNTTAIVEFVDTYYEKGQAIIDLKISNYVNQFRPGERIFCFFNDVNGEPQFLSATLFSGIITATSIIDGGENYLQGATIPLEGGGGTGGQIVITKVTDGFLTSIGTTYTGAGFQANDNIIILGGGGAGANGRVKYVDSTTQYYHPNSYNVIASIIGLEANTAIGNTIYANLEPSIIDPANAWIANSMVAWVYANCGPIQLSVLENQGNNYISQPSLDVQSNSVMRAFGVLGRVEILDGGVGYQAGDKIEFINQFGDWGTGASANVTSVDINGTIQEIKFEALPGHLPGGHGYRQDLLPIANVVTTTGSGAYLNVTSTICDGESLVVSTSTIGTILSVKILSSGTGYVTAPTLNLANMSSGSGANIIASIVSGIYTYPGRYLNDDGQVSSYNFLQDRDYYQNYSYVVKIDEPLSKYKKALKDLTHPAGMKLFGEYQFLAENDVDVVVTPSANNTNASMKLTSYYINTSDVIKNGSYNIRTMTGLYSPVINTSSFNVSPNVLSTYDSRSGKIYVNSTNNTFRVSDLVYLTFDSGYANIVNGMYTVVIANTKMFAVDIVGGNSSLVSLSSNVSNLTISTGPGVSTGFINVSDFVVNSNVPIKTGDSIIVEGNTISVLYADNDSDLLAVYPEVSGNIVANNLIIIPAPFNANGNVRIYDPTIKIFTNKFFPADSSVYLKFRTSDTSYANNYYKVIFGNTNVMEVTHKNIIGATILNGTVNVYSNAVSVVSDYHELEENELVYLTFLSGDMANTSNNFYNVSNVSTNNFTVITSNAIMSVGTVGIKTSNVSISLANHGFRQNDSVYMWFTSGDTANVANGYYEVSVKDINTLYITVANNIQSNGEVSVYRNYMNVTMTRASHGFNVGDNVSFMIEIGDTANISNGIYRVNKVANTNSYNIIHNLIITSGNLQNILARANGYAYVARV